MNNQRRKSLEDIKVKLDELKELVELARDDEQEYWDNMPESIQASDKGTKAEEAIGYLEEMVDSLDTAVSGLESAIE